MNIDPSIWGNSRLHSSAPLLPILHRTIDPSVTIEKPKSQIHKSSPLATSSFTAPTPTHKTIKEEEDMEVDAHSNQLYLSEKHTVEKTISTIASTYNILSEQSKHYFNKLLKQFLQNCEEGFSSQEVGSHFSFSQMSHPTGSTTFTRPSSSDGPHKFTSPSSIFPSSVELNSHKSNAPNYDRQSNWTFFNRESNGSKSDNNSVIPPLKTYPSIQLEPLLPKPANFNSDPQKEGPSWVEPFSSVFRKDLSRFENRFGAQYFSTLALQDPKVDYKKRVVEKDITIQPSSFLKSMNNGDTSNSSGRSESKKSLTPPPLLLPSITFSSQTIQNSNGNSPSPSRGVTRMGHGSPGSPSSLVSISHLSTTNSPNNNPSSPTNNHLSETQRAINTNGVVSAHTNTSSFTGSFGRDFNQETRMGGGYGPFRYRDKIHLSRRSPTQPLPDTFRSFHPRDSPTEKQKRVNWSYEDLNLLRKHLCDGITSQKLLSEKIPEKSLSEVQAKLLTLKRKAKVQGMRIDDQVRSRMVAALDTQILKKSTALHSPSKSPSGSNSSSVSSTPNPRTSFASSVTSLLSLSSPGLIPTHSRTFSSNTSLSNSSTSNSSSSNSSSSNSSSSNSSSSNSSSSNSSSSNSSSSNSSSSNSSSSNSSSTLSSSTLSSSTSSFLSSASTTTSPLASAFPSTTTTTSTTPTTPTATTATATTATTATSISNTSFSSISPSSPQTHSPPSVSTKPKLEGNERTVALKVSE